VAVKSLFVNNRIGFTSWSIVLFTYIVCNALIIVWRLLSNTPAYAINKQRHWCCPNESLY
jgi:hypothetical protein